MRTILIANCDTFEDPDVRRSDMQYGSLGALAGIRAALEPAGWQVRIDPRRQADAGDADWVLLDDIPKRQRVLDYYLARYRDRLALLASEPATFQPRNWDPALHAQFRFVIGWNPACAGTPNYWLARIAYDTEQTPRAPVPFAERKLCVMITCNKFSRHPQELYTARRQAVRFFERHHPADFDLYGHGWQSDAFGNPCFPRSRKLERLCAKLGLLATYPSWRGTVHDKLATMAGYRFALCYENGVFPGYITEKLFDCCNAMTVPVYLGAPDIAAVVPPAAFVDRRQFADDAELYRFLAAVTPAQYQAYLDAMRDFLASDAYRAFGGRAFGEVLRQAVEAAV
jgi:hypothetical protein